MVRGWRPPQNKRYAIWRLLFAESADELVHLKALDKLENIENLIDSGDPKSDPDYYSSFFKHNFGYNLGQDFRTDAIYKIQKTHGQYKELVDTDCKQLGIDFNSFWYIINFCKTLRGLRAITRPARYNPPMKTK